MIQMISYKVDAQQIYFLYALDSFNNFTTQSRYSSNESWIELYEGSNLFH